MKIISHRGCWQQPHEKNQQIAFMRAFDLGYGVETDFRDCAGEIVISHDMPTGSEVSAQQFFSLLVGRNILLAINIKSDGLAATLQALLQQYNVTNYFVFDMSVPDMLQYLNSGMRVFARVSEYEENPVCYDQVAGIWVDAFHNIWCSIELIQRYLSDGKEVCLVSPELHQRDEMELWCQIKRAGLQKYSSLMLCTDLPEKAGKFFLL